jgi:glycosyltransferase involved in cell wall biosynthesis
VIKKKILLIIPNLGFGGAQRVFYDLSNCLSSNFEVFECVFNFDDGHAYPSTNKIFSLDVPGGNTSAQKAWYFFKRILRLKKLKKKLQVDYAISHLEGADYINILSVSKEKVIVCIHGSKKYDEAISGAVGWVRKKILIPIIYNRADKIVTVAEGIKDELIKFFGIKNEKLTIINNGFNVRNINEKGTESFPDEYNCIFTKPVLITHGRIAKEKDHRFLIKLLAHPLLRGKVNLVIIGTGPLLQELVDYSISLDHKTYLRLENQPIEEENFDVFFLGFQSNPFQFLKRASVFVFPSLFEGFPLALVEAMVCGLPAISRNCPYGPGEILNPDKSFIDSKLYASYGILISNNLPSEIDIQLWAESISDLLQKTQLKSNYQMQSIKRSNLLDIKYFCEGWLNLITNLR